ncbi:MAG: hypothetical protein BZ135_01410 [Methanosphaera sp. rholeuAM6]|nr:MAG: hypothetical protein BZ135_01410 [Methanosphaera sp. rholeuAM6]
MKFNKIVVTLLILGMLSCGFTAVFAEQGTLADGTAVEIPEGYSLLDTGSGLFTLSTDDQESIILVMYENVTTDTEKAKESQVSDGAEFISEQTVQINGVDVIEQKFSKDGYSLGAYIFTYNDVNYVVTFTTKGDVDASDAASPINVVITSLTGGAQSE